METPTFLAYTYGMQLIASIFILGIVVGYVTAGLSDAQIAPQRATSNPKEQNVVQTESSGTFGDIPTADEIEALPSSQATMESVVDERLNIRFLYRTVPNGYTVTKYTPSTSDDELFIGGYQLVLKSEQGAHMNASEGPPDISVRIFKNSDRLSPRVWAESNTALSNFGLLQSAPTEVTFARVAGIRYVVEGLYRIDTVILSQGNRIYMITGAYGDDAPTAREDVASLLTSFELIRPQ
jgi:hypothetical protein